MFLSLKYILHDNLMDEQSLNLHRPILSYLFVAIIIKNCILQLQIKHKIMKCCLVKHRLLYWNIVVQQLGDIMGYFLIMAWSVNNYQLSIRVILQEPGGRNSREKRFIHIATHTHLNFKFKPALYSSTLLLMLQSCFKLKLLL